MAYSCSFFLLIVSCWWSLTILIFYCFKLHEEFEINLSWVDFNCQMFLICPLLLLYRCILFSRFCCKCITNCRHSMKKASRSASAASKVQGTCKMQTVEKVKSDNCSSLNTVTKTSKTAGATAALTKVTCLLHFGCRRTCLLTLQFSGLQNNCCTYLFLVHSLLFFCFFPI